MYSKTSSEVAAAKASGVGYAAKRAGVTMLTRLSVHWAESMTATRHWKGLAKWSSLSATGMLASNQARILWNRSFVVISSSRDLVIPITLT